MIYLKGLKLRAGLKAIWDLGSINNTSTIITIIRSFNGFSREKQIKRWATTEIGQQYMTGQRLSYDKYKDSNRDVLGKRLYELNDGIGDLIPKDTRAYTMQDAWGLWQADSHDISHVITGYGTDGLGELLRAEHARNYEGQGWRVVRFIIKLRFWLPHFIKHPNHFFLWREQIREARRHGDAAQPYLYENWFKFLDKDMHYVRWAFNVSTPKLYEL